ncbi:uncharacterized protein ASCRUDRAFT_85397 [Ascoidea rubescens DSM 1968]|uniref:Uncharacterized protein n=1 Tax=Ascoidea rubescens DSM 1968 TaxID=1344418 RepID=A0A1D2VJW1_9ASCO|nr:hypothetical protein ASCRUDRAFT_85397 [Ascoidea rubescens DSM 1968]ODV61889.1 hypothetical protein ASCRUDRAFT_85397 [Ascoidea rubescens DSM 1968]
MNNPPFSAENQVTTDSLLSPSTSDRSKCDDTVVHILPSFQMYETFIKSNSLNTVQLLSTALTPAVSNSSSSDLSNKNSIKSFQLENPPAYQPISTSSSTNISNFNNSLNSNSNPNPNFNAASNDLSTFFSLPTNTSNSFNDQTINESNNEINREPIDLFLDAKHDNLSTVLYDNIQNLSEKLNHKISIKMVVTKSSPSFHIPSIAQGFLKEFTTGDLIEGYVIIQNLSSNPIPFHNFYVSLEGTIYNFNSDMTYKKQILSMVDLSASWSFGSIISPNDDRILEPNTKYKKLFYFKVPNKLLDSACHHNYFYSNSHLNLPPSLGIECKEKEINRSLSMNKISGVSYFDHTPGSPYTLNDFSDFESAVCYSLNSRLICHINSDISSLSLNDFFISSKVEYNIRIIPSSKPSHNETLFINTNRFKNKSHHFNEQLQILENSISNQINNLERLSKLNNENCIDTASYTSLSTPVILNTQSSVNGNLSDRSPISGVSSDIFNERKKKNQLTSVADSAYNFGPAVGDLKNEWFDYQLTLKRHKTNNIFSGFFNHNTILSKKPSIDIVLQIKPPDYDLPYLCPELVLIKNPNLKAALNDYYSESNLKELDVFLTLNNIKPTQLKSQKFRNQDFQMPEITSVSLNLIAVTTKSSTSVPFDLPHGLFLNKNSYRRLINTFNTFDERINNLEKGLILEVDNSVIQIINCFKSLKYKEAFIPGLFDVLNSDQIRLNSWQKKSGNQLNDRSSWETQFKIQWRLRPNIKKTLVPDFQSCLISRFYFIRLSIVIDNAFFAHVQVPINVSSLGLD